MSGKHKFETGQLPTRALTAVFDGAGTVLTTGTKASTELAVPFACTIVRSRLWAPNETGSIVLDVWKDTYANRPPTNADSICASAKPTLSSDDEDEDSTLTGWTTTITAGDHLLWEIESVTSLTYVVHQLWVAPVSA